MAALRTETDQGQTMSFYTVTYLTTHGSHHNVCHLNEYNIPNENYCCKLCDLELERVVCVPSANDYLCSDLHFIMRYTVHVERL
jgi:hypothetical protein